MDTISDYYRGNTEIHTFDQIYLPTVSNVKRVMQIRIYSKKWRGNNLNRKILPLENLL